jgi:N-acetylglutamate synthase-like GNAT family acetyltransferase
MIRQATRYDIPRLLEIVESYAYENPIKILGEPCNHFPRHVEELLFSIIQGKGFIYIDNHMRGAIIAIKQNNIWSPKVRELHELLWWVEPEYRNQGIGKSITAKAVEFAGSRDRTIIITTEIPKFYTDLGFTQLGSYRSGWYLMASRMIKDNI